jgi:hypothetical protein
LSKSWSPIADAAIQAKNTLSARRRYRGQDWQSANRRLTSVLGHSLTDPAKSTCNLTSALNPKATQLLCAGEMTRRAKTGKKQAVADAKIQFSALNCRRGGYDRVGPARVSPNAVS